MEKITKYFKHDYENDTTIEYVNTGLYSMLNCSYTSEDPDYGTDTIHFTATPAESMEQMAYNMLYEIKDFLDYRDGSVEAPRCDVQNDYGEYSNSTLIAIEYALADLSKGFNLTKRYATIRDASEWIAKELIVDRRKEFAFCESDYEEAKGNPLEHKEEGGWHGVKRIDGFFDNDPEEFIIAVGYYGGGDVAFGYNGFGSLGDVNECAKTVCRTICKTTGWDSDNMIYIEEEEK